MKVLFYHPANYLEIGIPQGIALLSAILKRQGHTVELFDTTFLKPRDYAATQEPRMAGPTIYKKTAYTLEDLVQDDPVTDILDEFPKKISEFKPDLLAVSAMTTNYQLAIDILRKVKVYCPIILGGVHPTIKPEEVITEKVVDIICIGEGEEPLVELCQAMEDGKDYTGIKNLWVKCNGKLFKNDAQAFVDLDTLPCPDWSIFDERHLFRPFMGEIYKGSFYISSRGCPGACTYCVNLTLRRKFEHCGRYFRYQKPETTISHLVELKNRYNATWFKFGDDTFLLQPRKNLHELAERMKPLNIMFGCSVRPDTVSEEKVKLVKEMGCVAMSIGIETGNERIRREVLNRQISNQQIERAFSLINKNGIRISTFNLIGLPTETRQNVFETIAFNQKLQVKSANVYIVYPFPGTQMYMDHQIKYKTNDDRIIPMSDASAFSLSCMSAAEVEGLKKTFNLYLCLPKQLWPIIRLSEENTCQGGVVFDALNDYASVII